MLPLCAQRLDLLLHPRVVFREQVHSLGDRALTGPHQLGVAAHPRDRHSGLPQADQHSQPGQIVLIEPASPAVIARDAAEQPDPLVVPQGVQAETRAPHRLAGRVENDHAPSLTPGVRSRSKGLLLPWRPRPVRSPRVGKDLLVLYRRRNAASSADVLVLHMLSATLIVCPGGTIASMRS